MTEVHLQEDEMTEVTDVTEVMVVTEEEETATEVMIDVTAMTTETAAVMMTETVAVMTEIDLTEGRSNSCCLLPVFESVSLTKQMKYLLEDICNLCESLVWRITIPC
mmetsp:Transcript_16359/g.21498  ORF Transcript_16359/g.21498 Transcript_16359/m.21498 type:complete len:107 (+) Transcript_16359:534-854(+)